MGKSLKHKRSLCVGSAKRIYLDEPPHTHHTNKLSPPHKPIVSQHIVTSLTSHLPLQNLNTHQNIFPHSHNTTQSTTTLLATYHHPISPKKSLVTQPAKLIDTQLYQKQQHTHHTNKLTPHLQTNHLSTHCDITHLTPTTPKSQHPPKHLPSLSQYNSINYNTFGNISPSHIA